MQLTETHIIRRGHRYYDEIDALSFKSKNLYNYALYQIRQCYFDNKSFLNYMDLYNQIRYEHDYSQLPDKVSKGTLRKLYNNYTSFFNSTKDFKSNPSKYKAAPQIPRYLDKLYGRYTLIYEKDALNIKDYKKTGEFKLSKTNISIKSKININDIAQVQIVRMNFCYKICVIYNIAEEANPDLNYDLYGSIDLGLNNLATLVSNKLDFAAKLYNGKPLKAINQGYNKRISKYKSELPSKPKKLETSYVVTEVEGQEPTKKLKKEKTSKKIKEEYDRRKLRIDNYLHHVSTDIVNQLVSNNIGNLVVGLNKEWKQDINIGKINNQHFVSIPHDTLIDMLKYKCVLAGITFDTNEESYTSKCSFLDDEDIEKHINYLGKRIHRGLFKTSKGILINADVNGAYNILKKYFIKKLKVDVNILNSNEFKGGVMPPNKTNVGLDIFYTLKTQVVDVLKNHIH